MKREDNILSDADGLYAEDLNGRDAVLTIKSIEREKVDRGAGGAVVKYVFRFAETSKRYIPGIKVRRDIVRALQTNDRNEMIGKRIVLFPTTCDAFGQKDVPCIRFRGLAGQQAASRQDIDGPENQAAANEAKRVFAGPDPSGVAELTEAATDLNLELDGLAAKES